MGFSSEFLGLPVTCERNREQDGRWRTAQGGNVLQKCINLTCNDLGLSSMVCGCLPDHTLSGFVLGIFMVPVGDGKWPDALIMAC